MKPTVGTLEWEIANLPNRPTPTMKLAPNPYLSDYLEQHVKAGVIDFRLRASLDSEGSVKFYIHPATGSGRTEDYWLRAGKVEVMNLRGLNALIEAAMRPKKTTSNKRGNFGPLKSLGTPIHSGKSVPLGTPE